MASKSECEKNVKKFCEMDTQEVNSIQSDDIPGLTKTQNNTLRTSNYAHYYTPNIDRNCRPLKEK